MRWFDAARARLHLLVAGRAAESRMDEEVQFHIDMEADRLMREEKLSPEEARRRARVAFGGVTQHTEALREGRGVAWLGGVSLDAKLAGRMLVKNPGLTFVAVVGISVAVAIGAVSFSVISATIDGKLPFKDGDRIVGIENIDLRSGAPARNTHLHDIATWREALSTVEEIGAYHSVDRNLITADGRSESMRIAEMSASGFRITGVPPLMGRVVSNDDERAGAEPVAVIGYDVWQARFAARADIIGQTIRLGDERYAVIGVMPKDFAFPVNDRVWTPLRLNPADYERGRAPAIDVFGRLAPNATLADARRQIATIGQRLSGAYPDTHEQIRSHVHSYAKPFTDNSEAAWGVRLIQLLVSMLLVVIGTNVAILVYARTAGRMGEIAIRTALGASRSRIVGQLFAEALALSVTAAGVGVIGAHVALERINAMLTQLGGQQLPFWWHPGITPGVVVYAMGMAIAGAVIVGVVPALKATRNKVQSNLQQLSSGSSSMRLGKTWTFLVIAEVAIAVAVLPLAIGAIAAWKRLDATEAKTAAKQILTAKLTVDRSALGGAGIPASDSALVEREFEARSLNLRADFARRLNAEPGVATVAFASQRPGQEAKTWVEAGGAPVAVGAMRVDLHFFDALDIPLLAGRGFQAGDLSAGTTPVIVNRSFAQKLLAGSSPLGQRLRVTTNPGGAKRDLVPAQPWEEIVGVIPDFPVDSTTPQPKVYRPLLPTDAQPVTIAVRMQGGEPTPFTNRLRVLAIATSPLMRLQDIKSLAQAIHDDAIVSRLTILTLELVTMSTVLLSAAGIYALMAFTITRRRREIGIRSALGAGASRVLISVFSRALGQVAVGIIVGISVAAVFDHLLNGGWTGRRGLAVLPAVAVLMAVIGLIAAIEPASRALRIQPTEALKSD
jgi:predicted permease